MRRTILLFCLVSAFGQSGAPGRGVLTTFQAACDKANEGKRLMLEGYLDFPERGFGDSDTTVMMRLRPRLASWEFTVGAKVKIGNGASNVEMPPSNYKKTDVKLHLADGLVVTYANKVKVSGTMYYVSALGPGEYTCGLNNTLLERGSGWQPAPK